MTPKFLKADKFTAKWERGTVNHPADPGGLTKDGVSLNWLKKDNIDINGDGEVNAKDVHAVEDASPLFYEHFWMKAQCEDIPWPLDTVVYDSAVNMGLGRAIRMLQKALGLPENYHTGNFGPITRNAIRVASPISTAKAMVVLRQKYYNDLAAARPAMKVFLNGWTNRCNDLLKYIGA